MQHNKQPMPSLKAMALVYESFMLRQAQQPPFKNHHTQIKNPYIFLLYCPPTSNKALVICPNEQYLTVSIKASNIFPL